MYLISDNIDTLTGMRLAGVEGVIVHEHDELKEALERTIADKEIGIILLTEKFGREFPEIIDDVRGVGLMLAVEFVTSDIGYSIAKGLFSRGVMTAGTLVNSKCIRFEPTAVITEEQIAAVIERMDAALADTKKEYNL